MKPIITDSRFDLYHGGALEVLRSLPDGCAHTCVTSPPYFGLRRYEGCDPATMIGLEDVPDCLAWARGADPCGACFVCKLRAVFREVFRVLRPGSTLFLNLGDSYAGSGRGPTGANGLGNQGARQGFENRRTAPGALKPKDLMMIPSRVAMALQADGWYLRTDIVWVKGASFGPFHGAPMPESVTDRPTRAHEFLFLLANAREYHYDADIATEPCSTTTHAVVTSSRGAKNGSGTAGEVRAAGNFEGYRPERRNLRDCWTLLPDRNAEEHFASFPRRLVRPCVQASCPGDGVVLDPFAGTGTTGVVALEEGRRFIGIDLSETYLRDIAAPRLSATAKGITVAEERNGQAVLF